MAALAVAQPTSHSDSPPDLPTVCSEYDHGGGVLSISKSTSKTTFIIYTTAALLPSLQALRNNPPPVLVELASAVAERIPIYLTASSLPGELCSMPSPAPSSSSGSRSTEIGRLPHFFLNSAQSSNHAIVGRGTVLETLLSVLLRPWCILELCCVPAVEGVRALLDFAGCAAGLGLLGCRYRAAEILFAHELRSRWDQMEEERVQRTWTWAHTRTRTGDHVTGLQQLFCPCGLFPPRGVTIAMDRSWINNRLRDLCAAIFCGSMGSYNGFWLRLVCVVSLELGVGCSRLGALLGGSDVEGIEFKMGDTCTLRRTLVHSSNQDQACGNACGRRRSTSAIEHSERFEGVLDGARGVRNRDRRLNGRGEAKEFFVSVYRRILQQLGDAEVYTVTRSRSGAPPTIEQTT